MKSNGKRNTGLTINQKQGIIDKGLKGVKGEKRHEDEEGRHRRCSLFT